MMTLMSSHHPAERFVDGVVEHFEHHVVQAGAVGRVADVHAGALAHRVQALEDLDAGGIVVASVGLRIAAGACGCDCGRGSLAVKQSVFLFVRCASA